MLKIGPAIIAAVVVAITATIITVVVSIYVCKKKSNSNFDYESVKHDLDDEELEFKKSLELQSSNMDEFISFGDNDLDFNPKDLSRLSMLEKYRKNLVDEAANPNSKYEHESDDAEDIDV